VFGEIFKFSGVRKKLLVYYFIVIVLMGITSFYSYYNAKFVITRLNSIFKDYIYLNKLYINIDTLEAELEKYLSTKSSEALLNYYTLYNVLQDEGTSMPKTVTYNTNDLMLKDIGYMIDELLKETDAAVNAKRGRKGIEYLEHFANSSKITEYIKYYINELLYNKLKEGSAMYESISTKMNFIMFLNVFIIIASFVFNIFLALILTHKMTGPIIKLSRAANKIANGDFDVEPFNLNLKDEIGILSKAFDKMVISIRNYIESIKKQAEIENKLREQEMQNLKIKNSLKEAELKALQSQINPHFLFNTLNTAAQLAMLEGADKSHEFINKAADLFRYSLKRLDKPVFLREEIEHIKSYIYVLKTRFGDKVDFYLNIPDGRVLDIKIPGIILQPLVENAFIHGLECTENNGKIYLNVINNYDHILIEVIDNGKGMPQDKINEIINVEDESNFAQEFHVTGIGLRNVIKRLKLFYSIEDTSRVIELYSKEGVGTRVAIKIPMERREGYV